VGVFQKNPNRRLMVVALLALSLLALMVLLVGILSVNVKIIISALPFIFFATFYIVSRTKG